MAKIKHDVKNLKLAKAGMLRIEWAGRGMPVLRMIAERFEKEKPLKGIRIGACLHVTTETANLMAVLRAAGASVAVCASNPLSTQDDVAAAIVKCYDIPCFSIKGENAKTYYSHIRSVLETEPHITMDDGADLVSTLHTQKYGMIENVVGGTEETTTGVIRLRSMAAAKVLRYPIIAVNDADTKRLFDNRYGTGQSTLDGMLRATNRLIAGSTFVICGYGQCGKGLAARASGMGAGVVVTEVKPVRALEAVMDGFRVMPIREAAKKGDFFCTVTGDINVIRAEHFLLMKDGAVVANSGHFNVELDLPGLAKIAVKRRTVRAFVEEYTLGNGKLVNVLGEGRLINLAAAEGHPPAVMDMSFADQALSVEHIVNNRGRLAVHVHAVPEEIDDKVAELKLRTMKLSIDRLTPEQEKYLQSWEMGT